MPIPVTCPGCGTRYNLKDELAGKALACRQCKSIIKVASAAPATEVQVGIAARPKPAARPAPPPLPVAAKERIAPPPLRRARDDYEDDYDEGDFDDRDYDDRDEEHIHPAFDRDKFLMRQKHFAINQKYYIQDERGRNILFVERPAHLGRNLLASLVGIAGLLVVIGIFAAMGVALQAAVGEPRGVWIAVFLVLGIPLGIVAMFLLILWLIPKRHIQFYTDDAKRELLLEVLQDAKFMPINARYTVIDPDGNVLAKLRKNYLYNLFRRRWYIYDPDGREILLAMEDSLVLSLLRRFIGPLFGILRTNFIITKPDGEKLLGEFIRKFTLLDRYILDMSRDRRAQVDRRIAVALGIMLDTGEHR